MLNPNMIDVSGAEIVAHVTSDRPGVSHWTELGVFFLPGVDGRVFVARAEGCSRVPGQTTRRRTVYVGTLDRALEFFDDGDLKDALVIQAKDWDDRNRDWPTKAADAINQLRAEEAGRKVHAGGPKGYVGDGTLIDALRWLYDPIREQIVSDNNLVDAFAGDFGVPARTVRESLKNQKDGKKLPSWAGAFVGSLMHFDRGAFLAMRGAG